MGRMSFLAIFGRLCRHWRQNGTKSTFLFILSRIWRREQYVVFEALLDTERPCPTWEQGESLVLVGPENIDAEIGLEARKFLGGDAAHEHLEGVRHGDRLFLVKSGGEYQHCGYILFDTPQTAILGEPGHPPLIASCLTAPAARGRGLYRKALTAELLYLKERGYQRVVIETDPSNIPSRRGIEAAGFHLCRELSVSILLNHAVFQTVKQPVRTWRAFILSKSKERAARGAR